MRRHYVISFSGASVLPQFSLDSVDAANSINQNTALDKPQAKNRYRNRNIQIMKRERPLSLAPSHRRLALVAEFCSLETLAIIFYIFVFPLFDVLFRLFYLPLAQYFHLLYSHLGKYFIYYPYISNGEAIRQRNNNSKRIKSSISRDRAYNGGAHNATSEKFTFFALSGSTNNSTRIKFDLFLFTY